MFKLFKKNNTPKNEKSYLVSYKDLRGDEYTEIMTEFYLNAAIFYDDILVLKKEEICGELVKI